VYGATRLGRTWIVTIGDTEKDHNPSLHDADQKLAERQDSAEETAGDAPKPNEEALKQAREDMDLYREDRPTVVLPGSGGTVSGTAVNDWLDGDGNPKYHSIDDDSRAPAADAGPSDDAGQ
jgi:hypothetical protein